MQLDLFEHRHRLSRDGLTRYLNENARTPVDVHFTRNRVTMLSVAFPADGPIQLRLHEKFLEAPPPVIEALRLYLRTRRRAAWRIVTDFGCGIPSSATHSPPRLCSKGCVHDLQAIMKQVNQTYFNNRVRCRITWGRRRPKRSRGKRRTCIHYGTYDPHLNLVRIHPLLDDERVPREFVEYIVFHEMLHAVVPPERHQHRVVHHTPAFRRIERTFPDWERMKLMSDQFLRELV